jgi:hypothetical protein
MLPHARAHAPAGSPERVPAPDDLLFAPDDEPLDMIAVRRDDVLVDAIAAGGTAAALLAIDDPLIRMLVAWASSAREEAPDGSCMGVAWRLVRGREHPTTPAHDA